MMTRDQGWARDDAWPQASRHGRGRLRRPSETLADSAWHHAQGHCHNVCSAALRDLIALYRGMQAGLRLGQALGLGLGHKLGLGLKVEIAVALGLGLIPPQPTQLHPHPAIAPTTISGTGP